MTQLHATLFGAFTLVMPDGTVIRIETRKARALLAILIVARGRPLQRERLAGLLWSRGETRQALASLSQAVYSLKRALQDAAPNAIQTDPEKVAIDPDAFKTDVWELEAAAKNPSEAGRRKCLDLYCGEFLDDLHIDSEEGYSEWRNRERTRLEQLVTERGTALMEGWEVAPDAAEIRLVERLLSIDPYNEPALRVQMILLARDGRKATAIEARDAFTKLLASELGIAPSDRLSDVTARVRADEFAQFARQPPTAKRSLPHRSLTLFAIVGAVLCFTVALWFLVAPKGEPPTDIVRLLVRPFAASEGISTDLARGFSDDLSTELVRRAGLDVLSRESGRMLDADDDAAGGASHVLHGRMRSEDGRWVLNTWITEVDTDREVWAERFVGTADDPRAFRDRISGRIADGVGAALLPPADAGVIALPDGAVPDYLRALSQLHSGTAEGNAEAITRLTVLADAYPETLEPRAALVLAYERIAFGDAGFSTAAGLHWLEGYLLLKRELATITDPHPYVLAARARLALRRMDHTRARALARQALEVENSNITALEVLAQSLALDGDAETARAVATRAIALSPASPEHGYIAVALAAFAEENLADANNAVDAAFETTRSPSLELLILRAALLGLESDRGTAHDAFDAIVDALEDRPFGAWRVGDLTYSNPRAATWRRPIASEVAHLIRFSDDTANARLRDGLRAAASQYPGRNVQEERRILIDDEIEALLFNSRIDGQETWLVHQAWAQVRTPDGDLFQDGAFGPLPQAYQARSRIFDGWLCDSWVWEGTELESCQRVLEGDRDGLFFLSGEIGMFPFRLSDPAPLSIP